MVWKNKKTFLFISAVLILASFLSILWIYHSEKKLLEIGSKKIKIEISNTKKERKRGLSERNGLCENCGMLFVFDENGYHSFWMKEMFFDLDIIWISGNRVVFIEKNVPHEKGENIVISPEVESDKVLEIGSGRSDAFGITEGMEIDFSKLGL